MILKWWQGQFSTLKNDPGSGPDVEKIHKVRSQR